ncbi:ExbD/TolR family protein [Flavobacterium terrae]|uniref:Biopolymer transport protein ExbD/TolR n=1 Tax=Flavobacterium terrae TaxID=415425 RepID=A0A1M6EGW2_9FLAO|nr:biopolymer transporter ExbD [Flavobacterium terrae]SHI84714.1 Biopolymer transport protein ExbD/TolR [Flavobacterium terrae]
MNEAKNNFGRKPITPKTKKLHPRVDLTAMVSVSFLLIIFFMLTSFLSRSNMMNLGMPDNTRCRGYGGSSGCIDGSRVLTILIGKNNKTVVYSGEPIYSSLPPKVLGSEKLALRKELIKKSNQILEATGDPKKGLIVIIKPSKDSNYGDLVNVLDEMAIVKVPTYAVVDITPEEEALLSKLSMT